MAYISRDPFARTEIHRRREYDSRGVHTPADCSWCGRVKETRSGHKYLFRYSIESDGGRKSDITGRFCSVSCMRAYHEQ